MGVTDEVMIHRGRESGDVDAQERARVIAAQEQRSAAEALNAYLQVLQRPSARIHCQSRAVGYL